MVLAETPALGIWAEVAPGPFRDDLANEPLLFKAAWLMGASGNNVGRSCSGTSRQEAVVYWITLAARTFVKFERGTSRVLKASPVDTMLALRLRKRAVWAIMGR